MNRSERLKEYWRKVKCGELPKPVRVKNAPIRRTMRINSSWVRGNEIELTVLAHGELVFREPRKRQAYRVSIVDCHRIAVQITMSKVNARVKQLKKEGYGLAEARRKARKEML